jgi:hypothetical protein
MSEATATRLAWGIGLLCLASVVASLFLLALDWPAIDSAWGTQLPWFLDIAIAGGWAC